jgi:hypothetical protein
LVDIGIDLVELTASAGLAIDLHAVKDSSNKRLALTTMKEQLTGNGTYKDIMDVAFTPNVNLHLSGIKTGIAFLDTIASGFIADVKTNNLALNINQLSDTNVSFTKMINYTVTTNANFAALKALSVGKVIDVIVIVLDGICSSDGIINHPIMQKQIPLIGIRPSNVLKFAQRASHVIQELTTGTPASMQRLQVQLQSLFGPSVVVTVTYEMDAQSTGVIKGLVIRFTYQTGQSYSSRLAFDLASLAQNSNGNNGFKDVATKLGTLFDLTPRVDSLLYARATATVVVAIGFRLKPASGEFEPYIHPDTRLTGSIVAGASAINMSPIGGLLRLQLTNGAIDANVNFDMSVNQLTAAAWKPGNSLSQVFTGVIVSGQVTATLPLTASIVPGTFTIVATTKTLSPLELGIDMTCVNPGGGSCAWLDIINFNVMNFLAKDPNAFIDQIESSFQSLHETLIAGQNGIVSSVKLPLVRNVVASTLSAPDKFILGIKNKVVRALRSFVQPGVSDMASAIRYGLYNGLRNMGILQDVTSASLPINAQPPSATSIDNSVLLTYTNASGDPYYNQSAIACAADSTGCHGVEYEFTVGTTYTVATSTALDLGLGSIPLKFQSDGALKVNITWQLPLVIGYHINDGFYFRYKHKKVASFYISAAAIGLSSKGQFFAVEVTARQGVDDTIRLDGGLTVVPLHNRTTIKEIRTIGLSSLYNVSLQGDVEVKLPMTLHLKDIDGFPAMYATLTVEWPLTGPVISPTLATSQLIGSRPVIALRNVSIDAKSFAKNIVKPIVSKVICNTVLGLLVLPIERVLDGTDFDNRSTL